MIGVCVSKEDRFRVLLPGTVGSWLFLFSWAEGSKLFESLMNYADDCFLSLSFFPCARELLEITLRKYLNYFAEYMYHTFLLHLIDLIAIWFELFFSAENCCSFRLYCTTACATLLRTHTHTSLISFSLFSPFFLSFFCFTDHFRSLSPFVFPALRQVVSVWRQKLALFFLRMGGKPRALFFSFFCKENQGFTKTMTERTGTNNTQSDTNCHADSRGTLFWWTRFSEGTLRTGWQNCSRFF